jgi:hypothetical protein
VAAAFAALTREGYDGAQSATILAGLIDKIVAPSDAVKTKLKELGQASGIDLVADFSQTGLAARGLQGVINDVGKATDYNATAMFALLPALRGGRGELVLATQGASDLNSILGDLNDTFAGKTNPTLDSYARAQGLASTQAGEFRNQLKLAAADAGSDFLPTFTSILSALNGTDEGVKKAAIDIGLFAVGLKAAVVAGDLLGGAVAKVGEAMVGDATAIAADSAVLEANTAALTANAAARAASAATTAEATVAVEATTVETAGAIATAGTALTAAAAFAAPVTIGLGIVVGATHFIVDPLFNDKAQAALQSQFNTAAPDGSVNSSGAPNVKSGFASQVNDIVDAAAGLDPHDPNFAATEQALHDRLLQIQHDAEKVAADYHPDWRQSILGKLGVGDATAEQDAAMVAYAQAGVARIAQIGTNANASMGTAAPGYTPDPGKTAGPGSPGAGPDVAALAAQEKQQTADAKTAADSQAAYTKSLDKATADARTKANADAVQAQKDGIQEASDVQVAAATKSADAWKAANSEVGKIDLSKGIESLGALGTGIDKVRDDLAAMGQSDAALTSLAGIVDSFAKITDAESKASQGYQAYMGLLSESDTRITALDALKKKYDDAADAALALQKAGRPITADQQALISSRPAVDANIDAQKGRIQTNQAGDLVQAVKVAPDSAGFDDQFRAQIQAQGGAPAVAAEVKADTKQAESDLTAFEAKDRAAIVKIKADTKDAIANVDTFLAGIPSDKTTTVHVQYVGPDGTPLSASQIDNPGGVAGAVMPPYYQPPLPASDPRSSANLDNPGGPGAVAGAMPLAAGGGGAASGQSTQTPRGNAANLMPYADLIQQAAAAYHVPAWVLGAIIEHESGGNVGAVQPGGLGRGLTQVDIGQNPGYDEKRLTGTSRSDAAYQINSGAEILANFFKQYGGDANKAIQNYAGPAYRSQAGGGVPAGLSLPDELTRYYKPGVDAALGTGTGGTAQAAPSTDTAANTLRDQIVQKALQSVGQDKLVNYCEQFVEETVQAITGKRGATGQNENNATQAFQHAQAMGLEVPASQAQVGDLVYYPDANGGPGHVTVYKGKGEQISTYDGRPTPSGDKYAVHVEPVAPGARYISVGLPAAAAPTGTAAASAISSVGNAASNTTDLSNPNSPAAQQALAQRNQDAADLATSLSNVTVAAGQVDKAFAGMDPPAIAAATAEFARMQPILEKNALAKLPDTASAADKQLAVNAAWGQSLEYEAAYAKLLTDTINRTGDLAADTQKVADIVGGPMAAAYGQAAAASAQMAAATANISTLTDQHNQVVQQRQAADQASSRAQTEAGWAAQDASALMQARQTAASNALADKGTAENDRYTGVQRDEQDRQRQLQFSQQVQATDLQNRLTDLQKSQQSTVYQRTSQEQDVAGVGKAAATNEAAGQAAATLSLMHDQDLAQKDLNTKAIDDIQLQIRAQAKQANLESYNLQTETIQQQRQHENIMSGLSAQSTAQQRTFAAEQLAESQHQQAIARSTQLQQWQEQDRRQAEDAAYTAAIAAQNTIKTSAQASLDSATLALSTWQATGVVIASAASSAAASVQNNYAANPTYTRTLGSGSHAAGGTNLSGLGIVGDSPSGDMSSAEAVNFDTRTVYTHEQSVRMGLVPVSSSPIRDMSAQNGGTTINIGDLTVQANGDDEAVIARTMALVEARLRRAMNANRTQLRALGIN